MYFLFLHQYLLSIYNSNKFKVEGGGWSGRDYIIIILLSGEGWALITDDYGGGKNFQKLMT